MASDTPLATLGQETESWQNAVRRGMWVSAGKAIYAAITTKKNGGNFQVFFNKTTNGGVSWTELTPAIDGTSWGDVGTGGVYCNFAFEVFENRIYLAMVTSNFPAWFMRVGYWTMDTDTFTALPAQPALVVNPEGGGEQNPIEGHALTVFPNGDVTVYFNWNFNPTAHCYVAGYIDYSNAGSAWGAQTLIPGQNPFFTPGPSGSAQTIAVSQSIMAGSGRVFVFLYDSGTGTGSGGGPLNGQQIGYCITREPNHGAWNNFQIATTQQPFSESFATYPFGLGCAFSGGVIVPFMSGVNACAIPPPAPPPVAIVNMVLQSLTAADVPNPTFTAAVIDANISNGSLILTPGYNPFQDVSSSIISYLGAPYAYWWSATALVGGRPSAGQLRASRFSGGAWSPFTVYRFTVGPQLPPGVFGFDNANAMYYRQVNNDTTQTDMIHFLGPGLVPPPVAGGNVTLTFDGMKVYPVERG